MKRVQAPESATEFLYDASGERTVKYSGTGETLYYNSWWTETTDWPGFRRSKHIYLGSERIVTRLSMEGEGTGYEDVNTYYYHPDHLGSVHSVTDVEGNAYERLEYTPFGEMWVEIREDNDTAHLNYIPFRFTAKEWDGETGLYYYGARYYEPKLSRWMSSDPAGFQLVNPMEPDGEGGLRAKQNHSIIESTNWYSYVSNNPVMYVDPTGMWEFKIGIGLGAAFKFRVYSDNQGNWDVDVAAGAGIGAALSLDLEAKEVEPDTFSAELSFTGDVEISSAELSLTIDVVGEQDSSGEWTSQSDTRVSIPIPNTGGSGYLEYDVQEGFDKDFEMNQSFGGEGMFFLGVGDNLDEW